MLDEPWSFESLSIAEMEPETSPTAATDSRNEEVQHSRQKSILLGVL